MPVPAPLGPPPVSKRELQQRMEDRTEDKGQRLVAYRWFNPEIGITSTPTVEVRVLYDPATHSPDRIRWELEAAFHAMVRALQDEERKAHADTDGNQDRHEEGGVAAEGGAEGRAGRQP